MKYRIKENEENLFSEKNCPGVSSDTDNSSDHIHLILEMRTERKFAVQIRGVIRKFLAWSYISVTDLQTLSCLISFIRTIFPLCYGTNYMSIL